VNFKGTALLAHYLIPLRNANASLLGTNSGMITVGAMHGQGCTSYVSSKQAAAGLLECIGCEVQDLFVSSFHPGTGESVVLPSHLALIH
jgi:NAD(P)-dependent dehydrogenase (short-subunit alcohol dehydrogenase family)